MISSPPHKNINKRARHVPVRGRIRVFSAPGTRRGRGPTMPRFFGFALMVLLAAQAVMAADATPPVPQKESPAPPARLSTRDFVRHPNVGMMEISPTGRYLAKLTPDTGGNRLEILEVTTL